MIIKQKNLLVVKSTAIGSLAAGAGLRRGDIVLEVNGEKVRDELDFQFLTAEKKVELTVLRRNRTFKVYINRTCGEFFGIDFHRTAVGRCKNKCIFCFIDQMPTGLRKELYVKDEDWRHSFIHGNYVTLSSADDKDLYDIARYGFSPIYVSVHASDINIRRLLLGNPNIPNILEQLKLLEKLGVLFHTQIVVCPQINDGKILKKTISDLLKFSKSLLSIAVVPVGLTKYHKKGLRCFSSEEAKLLCSEVAAISDIAKCNDGFRKVFIADEFFIKAGLPIPPNSYYEKYPQIENGVGIVRKFIEEWKTAIRSFAASGYLKVRRGKYSRNGSFFNYSILTSTDAAPFVREMTKAISRYLPMCRVETIGVENTFFGSTVTVAGLLTARDIIRVSAKLERNWHIVVPSVIFNYNGYTLDGFSKQRLEKAINKKLVVVGTTKELINTIKNSL